MSETEQRLVEQAKNGSLTAFDELISIHQERVYRLAERMLGNRDDAADIQQETFVKAWKSIRKFRQEATFSTWLHRITVNLCLSHKRSQTADEILYDERMQSTCHSPLACLVRDETALQIRTVLFGMPAHHRALIVLRDMEERSFEEIGKILRCSARGARVRACRARKIMKERMRAYMAEDSL